VFNPLSTQVLLGKRANLILRWALFLYLGLILCPIRYWAPTFRNVDNTSFFALNYAAAHHVVMGRDVAWTWGPLSHLLVPFDIGRNLAFGLAFQIALWTLIILIVWDLFLRGSFPLRNLAVFSIFVGLSTVDYHQPSYPGNLLLCGALVLLVHFRLHGGMVRYVTALVMMGLIPLIQFVGAMIVVGVIAGLVVDRLLRDRRSARLEVALAIVVPMVVALGGCWLSLGSIQAIATYVRSSLEFTRYYSVIMSIAGPRIELVAALEAIMLLVATIILLRVRDRDEARFFSALLGIPLLLSIKHGFVRQDAPHNIQFFCFVALALALVALAAPLNERFANIGVAVVLLLFAIIWQDYVARNDLESAIVSVIGIRTPSLVWNVLRFNHLRRSLDTEGRENYSVDTRIEPEIKSVVGQEPVAFLSNVYSNALIDDLNLVLSPVLQRYAVITPYLDRLNATWIRNKGPRFLIFDGATIDGRHPWTESPATWVEVYRWYNTRILCAHNLLLQRRAEPRFSHFEPIGHLTARFGEEVHMPGSSAGVFWTMQCSLNTTGKLRALLFRVPEVTMAVDAGDGRTRSFRALLPMLGVPSPGNYLPSSLAEFAEVFSERENRDFNVAKLEFGGPGAAAYQQDCEMEFLRPAP